MSDTTTDRLPEPEAPPAEPKAPPTDGTNGGPIEHRIPMTDTELIAFTSVGEKLAPVNQQREHLMRQHDAIVREVCARNGVEVDLDLLIRSKLENGHLILGVAQVDKR